MNIGSLIEAVVKIGFPGAVAIYLLVFVTRIIGRSLERIEAKVDKVLELISKN